MRTWPWIVYWRGNATKQEWGEQHEWGTRQGSREGQHEGVLLRDPTMGEGDSVLPGLSGHHKVPRGIVC